jgi:hypothetical protein
MKSVKTTEPEIKEEGKPYKPAHTVEFKTCLDQFPFICKGLIWHDNNFLDFEIIKDKSVKTYNREFSFYICKKDLNFYTIEKKANV